MRAQRNILVIGGAGSGKTTLVNAIINEMVSQDPTERVFIIEGIGEIQCAAENYVQYHTSLDVSITMLLKTTLRMRPDRILVGEVRGQEALDLLDAWNTGHPGGAATLHANSAQEGLTCLKSLVSRNQVVALKSRPSRMARSSKSISPPRRSLTGGLRKHGPARDPPSEGRPSRKPVHRG